jgi:serine/threonine-protein kinase
VNGPAEPGINESGPPLKQTPAQASERAGELDTVVGETARRGARRVRTGDRLGRYELGDELGEGGMATVYRARDRELRREVAVKVLFPHLARRPEIVRRFHREARAAAGLEHPNILRIYDVGGGDQDPPYIVMELIRGRTLLQEIEQRGAMLAEVAACIGALLGDALAAAHAAGVIHRDVKPANVLIAPGGRLLLGDFGVARLETEDSLVTRTGALLGTPAYMSPEQASGDIATSRSDLYSLGATLYQLATGALPYAGPPAKVMSMIAAGGPVSPVRRRPACGPDLSRQIERLMAGDPGMRPASATEAAAELRALVICSGLGDPGEELAAYFEDPDGFLGARTPVVVGALVAAAHAALAEAKLPRAMALADRASALAPADPAVAAVIRAVTEGGHASRRKRALVVSGAVLAAAGGAVALGLQLSGDPGELRPAEPVAAWDKAGEHSEAGGGGPEGSAGGAGGCAPRGIDGKPAPGTAGTGGGGGPVGALEAPDAAIEPAIAPSAVAIDAGAVSIAAPVDARATAVAPIARRPPSGSPPAPDAGPPSGAGSAEPGQAAPPIAAAEPVPAPPVPLAVDAGAPPAPGHVIVQNDVWCNIWIDGGNHGNRRNEPLEVSAGHHVVRCVNPVGEWTQDAEVAPGVTRVLTGTLLRDLQVTLDVDATIDGKSYLRGAVVRLKPGNIEVIAGGKKQFITFRASCRLKDTPDLGCYL